MTLAKKLTAAFLLTMIFGAWTPGNLAAEEMGTVIGEGARKCTDFLKAKGRKQNNYMIWVQGYFTAYNAIAPDVTNVLGDRTWPWVLKRLQAHCEADPAQYFNEAVVALGTELHPEGIVLGDPNCKSGNKK